MSVSGCYRGVAPLDDLCMCTERSPQRRHLSRVAERKRACRPASHFNAPLEKSSSASVKASSAALGSALCKRCGAPRHLSPFSKHSEDLSSVTEWCECCALKCTPKIWRTSLRWCLTNWSHADTKIIDALFFSLFFSIAKSTATCLNALNRCHVIGWLGICLLTQLELNVVQKKQIFWAQSTQISEKKILPFSWIEALFL